MIQRIQSVYLVLAAVALASLPFLNFDAGVSLAWFTPTVIGLSGLAALSAVGCVALYANRERQLQAVQGVQVLVIVLAGAFYGGLFLAGGLAVQGAQGILWPNVAELALPIVAYGLLVLARRGIKKDIELVASMDRLR
ncbi:DUF4293 family protein [Salisaeta longa]|uniref:DUF4293 family protein n=1 Tax=Salisaeta longa TaxID=503170 RepID=UPI0003B3C0EB|nr:DUF4293 family protein [Salisaeta longa]